MPTIIELPWDSHIFGYKTGKVISAVRIPSDRELSAYQYVHVQILQDNVGLIWRYEAAGFRFVTIDFILEKNPSITDYAIIEDYDLYWIRKQALPYQVRGFKVDGSRFMLDTILRQHLSPDFWDNMIYDHSCNYVDTALCAVQNGKLIGFISCFEHHDNIEMFLIVVHPNFHGMGIGSHMLKEVENMAKNNHKALRTSVIAQNIKAINFYSRHGFMVKQANVVMHYHNQKRTRLCMNRS